MADGPAPASADTAIEAPSRATPASGWAGPADDGSDGAEMSGPPALDTVTPSAGATEFTVDSPADTLRTTSVADPGDGVPPTATALDDGIAEGPSPDAEATAQAAVAGDAQPRPPLPSSPLPAETTTAAGGLSYPPGVDGGQLPAVRSPPPSAEGGAPLVAVVNGIDALDNEETVAVAKALAEATNAASAAITVADVASFGQLWERFHGRIAKYAVGRKYRPLRVAWDDARDMVAAALAAADTADAGVIGGAGAGGDGAVPPAGPEAGSPNGARSPAAMAPSAASPASSSGGDSAIARPSPPAVALLHLGELGELVARALDVGVHCGKVAIVDVCVDCIHRLLEHGHLGGGDPSGPDRASVGMNGVGGTAVGSAWTPAAAAVSPAAFDDGGVAGGSGSAGAVPSTIKLDVNPSRLESAVLLVCGCLETKDEDVYLRMVQTLLTAVTSTRAGLHHGTLLAAVRTVYNIFLNATMPGTRTTARVALTRILQLVFSRMEAESASADTSSMLLTGQAQGVPAVGTTAASGSVGGGGDATDVADSTTDAARTTPSVALTPDGALPPTVTAPVATPELADADGDFPSILQQDAYLLFRALCKLSAKELDESVAADSIPLRSKLLSLELLRRVVRSSGPAFRSGERFVRALRLYLSPTLLANCLSPSMAVVGVALDIVEVLLAKDALRPLLKAETAALFETVLFRFLEAPAAGPARRQRALALCVRISSDSHLLADLFANYDCDVQSPNLFEKLVVVLSNAAQHGSVSGGSISASSLSSPDPSGTSGGGGGVKGEVSLTAAAASTASSMAGSMASLLSASTGFASSTAAAADAADAELRANALSGVVSIVQALRRWSRPAERALGDDPSPVGAPVDGARLSRSPLVLGNGSGELGDEPLTSEAALGGDTGPPPPSPPVASPVAGVGSVIEGSDYDMTPFEEAVRVKQLLVEGVTLFNAKPRKGIDLLVSHSVLDRDADAVAHFLRHTDGLDATSVGEYIGDGDEFNVAVMNAYTNAADLTGLTFDASLRHHLAGFRLPGEAQKIDRIMEAFAARFVACNPGVFADADVAFVLGFSTILLNTDAHNPQVKNKMTKEGFLRNNRGINNGGDVPAEVLSDLYDRIVANEIRISDTLRDSKHEAATKSLAAASSGTSSATSSANTAHNSELFRVQSERLLAQVRQQFARRRRTAYTYYSASNVQHARLMFSSVWMALLAALSQRLHCADGNDISTANRCLAGIRAAIAIASTYLLATEKVALVGALASFTRLGAVVDMRAKNVAAVRMLLAIAAMEGDHLGEQWTTVVRAVSQLQHVRTLSATTRTRRLSSSDSAPGSLGPSPLPTSPALPPSPAAGTIDAATPTAAATGSLRPSDENSRPGADEAAPTRRLSRSSTSLSKPGGGSSGSSSMDATAVDANAAALARGIDETEIERVFVNSAKLSASGLGDLLRALCAVSLEELGEPRLFCLVKLVETASLNVPARRAAEWRHLWETTLGTYFTAAMCHVNRRVALFAVDALRQLAIKLISVGDTPLPHAAASGALQVQQYSDQLGVGRAGSDTGGAGGRGGAPTGNTAVNSTDGNGLQRAVLRPYESCYARSRSTSVRELVLRCVAQLVAARSSVVQSGWKALFGVLVIAADERSESLLATAFGIVESVVRDHVGNLDDVFVGTVAALSAYAHNALIESVALSAIGYLSGSCPTTLAEGRATAAARPLLVRHVVPPSGAAVVAAASAAATGEGAADGNSAVVGGDAAETAEAAAVHAVAETVIERYEFSADVEAHIGAWFPILTGLASSVSDSRPAVRAAATEGLFRVLRAHGGTFGPSLWTLVFRGVISPLFDDVRHLPGGDRSQRLDSGGRQIPGGGSTGTGGGADQSGTPDTALPLWAAETGASALRALVDVSVEHWLAARHLLPDLLALLRSWVVQETEAVARKGVAALRLLLTGAGTRLSSSEWDAVVDALGGLFKDMSPVEILGPDGDTRQLMGSPSVADPASVVGSPGDMGSSRNDTGGREHELSDRLERRTSGRLERTATSDGTSSGGMDGEGGEDELAETRYIDFRVVRAKCVVQLLLVTTVQDTVVCFYRALSTSQLLALADALEGSYQFAHDFNANVELRYSLWRAGFMTQVPNLLKQETSGLAAYFRVLLWLYIDEARGAAAKSAVETRLLALLQRVLGGYAASCEHARSKPEEQREVAALTPVVVLMVRGQLQLSNDQFHRHLGVFFPLLLELVSTSEAREVRVAVKELLGARLSPLLGIGPTAAAAAAAAAADRRRYRRRRRSNGSDGDGVGGVHGSAHRGKVRDSSSDVDESTQPGKSSEDDDHEAGGTREGSSDDDELGGDLDDYNGDGGVAEFVPRPLLPGAARELVLSLDGVGGRSAAAIDASTALERVPGVTSVVVNVDNGTARVWAAAPEDMVLDAVRAVPAVTGVRVLHRVVVM